MADGVLTEGNNKTAEEESSNSQEGELTKAAAQVFQPEFGTQVDGKEYTALVAQVGESMVSQVMDDESLTPEQKTDKLNSLRSRFNGGAQLAVTIPYADKAISQLMGHLKVKDYSQLTPAQREGLVATAAGYFAGAESIGHTVGAIMALEQSAKLQGRETSEVFSEHVGILNGMREKYQAKGDGEKTRVLDEVIQKRAGFMYRFKEPGSTEMTYAPPYTGSN